VANVEPEAFTIDRTSLFVVDFHPPMAPDRYRVRSLDLATGTLNDVFSADKELQEDMRGTARTQAWSADGKRLYTLYTLEGDEHGEAAHAFIHVLDLDARWAHCIDLPAGTGIGESGIDLTVSPDGHTVFLADSTASTLVEVDAVSLRTTRTAALPGDEDATPTIAVDAAGRVLVASGSDLHTLDARNLRRVDTATLEAPITALQSAGDWIIAALGSELVVLDRAGQLSSRVRLPSAVTGIGTPTDLDAGRQRIECAC
jgi:dipeptidyl aminopeptidase/acylaminoacyl peptidase